MGLRSYLCGRVAAAAFRIVVVVGAATGAHAAQTPPNIIVFMADDLDVAATQTLLALRLMPNLQGLLVDEGVEFRQSFVTYPLCCPSRTTFLTGQYAHNHRVRGNEQPYGGAAAIDDSSTLATWLQAAGYHTAWVGKYLNGYGEDRVPDTPRDDPTYVPPGWTDWYALVDPSTYYVFDFQINENGSVVRYPPGPDGGNYQTDVLARIAAGVVARATDPLFLVVAPLAPHVESARLPRSGCVGRKNPQDWGRYIRPDPRDAQEKPAAWQLISSLPLLPAAAPSFNEQKMSDKPLWMGAMLAPLTAADRECLRTRYRSRLASMLAVDDLIGAVVGALGPERAAKTVLVFTSDNGMLEGQHRVGTKIFPYEESIRVPLYIHLPAAGGPRKVDALVLNNDLAPTIAELAGVAIPPEHVVDGRSLVPLLEGRPLLRWRAGFLIESREFISYLGVRTGPDLSVGGLPLGNMVYVQHLEVEKFGLPADDVELYDLETDPWQLHSRHDDPAMAGRRAALAAWLEVLRACAGKACVAAEDLAPGGRQGAARDASGAVPWP